MLSIIVTASSLLFAPMAPTNFEVDISLAFDNPNIYFVDVIGVDPFFDQYLALAENDKNTDKRVVTEFDIVIDHIFKYDIPHLEYGSIDYSKDNVIVPLPQLAVQILIPNNKTIGEASIQAAYLCHRNFGVFAFDVVNNKKNLTREQALDFAEKTGKEYNYDRADTLELMVVVNEIYRSEETNPAFHARNAFRSCMESFNFFDKDYYQEIEE